MSSMYHSDTLLTAKHCEVWICQGMQSVQDYAGNAQGIALVQNDQDDSWQLVSNSSLTYLSFFLQAWLLEPMRYVEV